ncbi:prepilin-type N-terminal cleavage/methylation domain-containing protein [Clostridium perfringens]|uniref:prepilin-type N-terminal cleavage/methylation domain-containing protein n=1 Tax=Clostridium perfringens TaxID=1502 RepID=UPI001A1FF49A|nr:prepilin-type N-terminal cleavage/methylation domain-containing protein [Clostridium perfringens]UBK71074.1 prepilin-type N-terminal cleavage/methylation domain-containing protein [Clostridium perfringens]HAT4132552.1 prepilin-type N-terminal cleavage/methylation domain-containing protein [Clostridium perfringens]HAT4148931.1 prepilin-type N-terminal cleavage/methylation domain-containing protein [Clostridium perfringens]
MNTKKQNKKKKGFTLIELIIVIAIIAILAAIAIPNFLGIQRKSKIKADIASAKTIYDATSAAIAEGAINPEELKIVSGKDQKVGESIVELNPESKASDGPGKAIEDRLQTIPTGRYTPGNFVVTITKGDNSVKPDIKVEIKPKNATNETKNILVYPNGENQYSINSLDGSGK